MSFGFSVGDFIAAAHLAHSLYKDLYLIARKAPEEISTLLAEIGILSKSIDWLVAEIQNSDSTLARSGKERVQLVNDVVKQTKLTLDDLDHLAKKHDFRAKPMDRAKMKKIWDKIKYAREKSSVDGLKARIHHHNGLINLLLTAAGNSSLERIENYNKAVLSDISGIKDMLANSPEPPVISMIEDEKTFQLSLSQAFMKEAERFRPWLNIGFDDWMQAGKWWLIKSQETMYTNALTDLSIPPQSYADLLKASWILIDILANPQLKRSPIGEYYQVQMLAKMIQDELGEVERMHLVKPELSLIKQVDLTIWHEAPKATTLQPAALRQGIGSWQSLGEVIYFQGFAFYRPEKYVNSFIECIILILVDESIGSAHIVVQTQNGIDVCNMNVWDVDFTQQEKTEYSSLERPRVDHQTLYGQTVDGGTILFTTQHGLAYFSRVLNGIEGYLEVERNVRAHKSLLGVVLLIAVSSGNKAHVTNVVRLGRSIFPIDINGDCNSWSSFEDIWHLAIAVAKLSLRGSETVSLVDYDTDKLSYHLDGEVGYVENNWLYIIFKTISLFIHSRWTTIFEPSKFGFVWEEDAISPITQAMFLACRNGDEDLVRTLLREHMEINTAFLFEYPSQPTVEYPLKLEVGRTMALYQAILGEREGVVRLLLEEGFALNAFGNQNETALHRAAKHSKSEIVALLLEKGADMHALDNLHQTPLYTAVANRNSGVFTFLLEKGSRINCLDRHGRSLLHEAALCGKNEIVEVLLEKGAAVNALSRYDKTPLHEAARSAGRDTVSMLLKKGADIDAIDGYTITPLHEAAQAGRGGIVKLLLEKGADINKSNESKETPLHLATRAKNSNIIEILLEKGADINKYNGLKETPLHLATMAENSNIVELLLEKGADINKSNAFEGTPLHLATLAENSDIVTLLIKKGADVNAQDKWGDSSMHYAAEQGKSDIVTLLLEEGADINAVNQKGLTPFLEAKEAVKGDVAKLLLEKGSTHVATALEYRMQSNPNFGQKI